MVFLQMIFVPGLHGHRVLKAAARVQCHGIECVCAKQRETQRVQLRSRQRETDRRISCVTNSPAQVSSSQQVSFSVSFLHLKSAALNKHYFILAPSHKTTNQVVTPATFNIILIWCVIRLVKNTIQCESFITITVQNALFLRPHYRLRFLP